MKNKKHIKAISRILLSQCEINRIHGNFIVDLQLTQEKIIQDDKDNIQDIIKLLEILNDRLCAVEAYNAEPPVEEPVEPEL